MELDNSLHNKALGHKLENAADLNEYLELQRMSIYPEGHFC